MGVSNHPNEELVLLPYDPGKDLENWIEYIWHRICCGASSINIQGSWPWSLEDQGNR